MYTTISVGENVGDRPVDSGQTVDAIPLGGWHLNAGCPKDREKVETRSKKSFREQRATTNCGELAQSVV